MTDLVDWGLAASLGRRVAPDGPEVSMVEATAAVQQLRELADEAVGIVAERTKLDAPPDRTRTVVVDRSAWIDSNLAGFQRVVAPMLEQLRARSGQPSAVTGLSAKVSAVEIGAVLGWLSGKVLGQYEAFVEPGQPGRLLLVAPNIVSAEQALDVDPHDFRLWVCIHEETHRVQFGAVPWLGEHFLSEVDTFLSAADLTAGDAARRLMTVLRTVARVILGDSTASLVEAAQSPDQREVFERLTALMSLLEGHAEFVMDDVGPQTIPSIETLRQRFERRRREHGAAEGLLRRLMGMDAKMRQYAEGRAFVTGVVELVGIDGFNRIWSEPATLPRLEEITDPAAWVRRVHGPTALP